MKFLLFLVIGTLLGFGCSVSAQEIVTVFRDGAPSQKTTYSPNYAHVPNIFQRSLYRDDNFTKTAKDIGIEAVLLKMRTKLRELSKDGRTLTREDIDAEKRKNDDEIRRRQLADLTLFDVDLDGKTTREEATRALRKMWSAEQFANTSPRKIKYIMSYDTDGDGVLTYKEMGTLRPDRFVPGNMNDALDTYMEMDSDHDDKVTLEELDHSVRASFAIVDIDKNGVLSQEEVGSYLKVQMSLIPSFRKCNMPSIPANSRFVVVGSSNGYFISDTGIGDYDQIVSAAEVSIETRGPVYVLFSTQTSVIFKFIGPTSGLAHVYSTSMRGNNGILNVPAEKVTFLPSGCFRHYISTEDIAPMRDEIAQVIGRAPDNISGRHAFSKLRILNDRVEYVLPQMREKHD